MSVIGFTGHQDLPEAARRHSERELRRLLADHPGAEGLCSLAAGSDQQFARLVLEAGHVLHLVIASHGYERSLEPRNLAAYWELHAAADDVTTLEFAEPCEPAFYAAGAYIIEHCDLLAAVWDGGPARGLGGTGDIVALARATHRPVEIIWPQGLRRD